jgi:hypothetical protein
MRRMARAWLLSVGALAALGCGDDNNPAGPGSLTQADLVGTWSITKLEHQEHAPGTRTFDEIADGGGTATITIQANGDYTVVITNGSDQETDTGNFEVTDEGVVDTSEGQDVPGVWLMTLNGTTLTGENPSNSFDFDQDGSAEEEADLSVTMHKAS